MTYGDTVIKDTLRNCYDNFFTDGLNEGLDPGDASDYADVQYQQLMSRLVNCEGSESVADLEGEPVAI